MLSSANCWEDISFHHPITSNFQNFLLSYINKNAVPNTTLLLGSYFIPFPAYLIFWKFFLSYYNINTIPNTTSY